MIEKILIPIDGSEHSDKALSYGLDFAEKYSVEILLLTVAQPIVATVPMFSTQPMLSPASITI